jgi:hypothetical protein
MDSASSSPLLDLFRRGEVPLEVRLLAARGGLAPRAHEQIRLLLLLVGDDDELVRDAAEGTLARIPREPLAAFVARADVEVEIREFFQRRGVEPGAVASVDVQDSLVADADESPAEEGEAEQRPVPITSLSIIQRMKLAMRGRREERAVLVRDPNRLVAAAVLSSPKLTESEVEAFARMANVSEEVLRLIGSNRVWVKKYPIVSALARNPKTPLGVSMPLVHHLVERDVKQIAADRSAPEPLRVLARKMLTAGQARRG